MITEWVRAAFSLGTVFAVMCAAHAQTPPTATTPPPTVVSLTETPFLDGPGPVSTSLDAIPFYHAGVWHVFAMQTEPLGVGHRSGRDLVHWEIHPLALAGHVAPGTVLEQRLHL